MTLIRHKMNLANVTNFDLPDQVGTWSAKATWSNWPTSN